MTYYNAATNSSTAGIDAIAFIEAGLTAASASWLFIEGTTFTSGFTGQPTTARVWKCLGSQNAGGLDFYVILTRSTSDVGTITVRLAEGYNPTTHAVIRPAQSTNSGAVAVNQTDFSIGNGTEYALAATGVGAQQDHSVYLNNSQGVDHFMVVSKSFIAYGANVNGVACGGFYVGNFDPSYSSTYNPVIAVSVGLNSPQIGTQSPASSVTRFPNYTTTIGSDAYLLPGTFPGGYLTTLSIAETFAAKMEASSVLVAGFAAVSGAAQLTLSRGGLRGTMPTAVMLQVSESSIPRNGDFFSVGAADYFRIGQATAAAYATMVGAPNRCFYVSKSATY